MGEGAYGKGRVNGLPTLKLLLYFECKMAHIMKGETRLKADLVGNIWGQSFDEPSNVKLGILI